MPLPGCILLLPPTCCSLWRRVWGGGGAECQSLWCFGATHGESWGGEHAAGAEGRAQERQRSMTDTVPLVVSPLCIRLTCCHFHSSWCCCLVPRSSPPLWAAVHAAHSPSFLCSHVPFSSLLFFPHLHPPCHPRPAPALLRKGLVVHGPNSCFTGVFSASHSNQSLQFIPIMFCSPPPTCGADACGFADSLSWQEPARNWQQLQSRGGYSGGGGSPPQAPPPPPPRMTITITIYPFD